MKQITAPLTGVPCKGARRPLRASVSHVMLPGHTVARAPAKRRETVSKFLSRKNWVFKTPTICVINGQPVMRAEWKRRKIRATDQVVFVARPMGGRDGIGKQVLGLVALITLTALAPGLGTGIAGALGIEGAIFGTLTVGKLIGMGIAIGGLLLVNALTTPKPGGRPDYAQAPVDQIYSISASGNSGKPLAVIPCPYGRLKRFPDYAAQPWSEYIGNDQYLNVPLNVGLGRFDPEKLFIDDTELWDKTTGVNSDFEGVSVAFYEPGANIDLFPTNVTQAIEVSGQEIPNPAQGWLGGFIANAAGSKAKALAIDVVLPGGCYVVDQESGALAARSVTIVAEARQVNAAGAPIEPFNTLFSETLTLATRTPQRFTFKREVLAGRYEVRVRRTTDSLGGTTGTDAVAWESLRAFLDGPSSFDGITIAAIRIKATAQLNQNSARRFGILATRILRVWDRDTLEWTEVPTRNAAWAFLDAASNTDYGAKRPISKIDFQSVVDLADSIDERGDTFDYEFSSAVTVPQAFDTILKSTRARHRWSGDVLSVVRDEWRPVPSMLLTDREIIRGSVNVEWSFNTEDSADAVILEYLDEETWKAAEVQYPPDTDDWTPTQPARIRVDGICVRAQAYREAQFYWNQSQKRRTNITVETEHDGRLLNFGSTVRVQSELPQTWGQGGVVAGVVGRQLTLDPAPTWGEGSHYIAVRTKTGKQYGPVKVARGTEDRFAILDSADQTIVEDQLGITIDDAIERADGADDPSYAFGAGTKWSMPCIVLSGRPSNDNVQLSLVVDDPSVHGVDGSVAPSRPVPPPLVDPPAPVITSLVANFRQGIAEPVLDASWAPAPGALYYLAEVSYDNGNSWTPVYEGSATRISVRVDYAELKLRVAAVGSRSGGWVQVAVERPTIEIDRNHFTSDVNTLLDFVRQELSKRDARMDEVQQLIASMATEQDADNWLDKYKNQRLAYENRNFLNGVINEVDTRLSSELAGATAEITTNATTIAALDGAFSTYQGQVSARFASVESSIATNATAISDVQGAFAGYQTVVSASFASQLASITANGAAIANLSGTFTSFQTTVLARFGNNEAAIATNATAISDLNGSFSSYKTTVSARFAANESSITQTQQSIATLNNSFATFQTTVGAILGDHQSQITANGTAISTLNNSFSSYQTSVAAQFGTLRTEVSESIATAIDGVNGKFAAQWTLQLDVNGYISAIKGFNDGSQAGFTIIGDIFKVAFPGAPGGSPVSVFAISNVDGVAKVVLLGDMLADGSVIADKLAVNSLSAISGNVGELIAGIIRSGNGKMVISLDDGTIKGYA